MIDINEIKAGDFIRCPTSLKMIDGSFHNIRGYFKQINCDEIYVQACPNSDMYILPMKSCFIDYYGKLCYELRYEILNCVNNNTGIILEMSKETLLRLAISIEESDINFKKEYEIPYNINSKYTNFIHLYCFNDDANIEAFTGNNKFLFMAYINTNSNDSIPLGQIILGH